MDQIRSFFRRTWYRASAGVFVVRSVNSEKYNKYLLKRIAWFPLRARFGALHRVSWGRRALVLLASRRLVWLPETSASTQSASFSTGRGTAGSLPLDRPFLFCGSPRPVSLLHLSTCGRNQCTRADPRQHTSDTFDVGDRSLSLSTQFRHQSRKVEKHSK